MAKLIIPAMLLSKLQGLPDIIDVTGIPLCHFVTPSSYMYKPLGDSAALTFSRAIGCELCCVLGI
jgi:hypothetical protein